MTATTLITSGSCAGCGRPARRDSAPMSARFAELLNRIPLRCADCSDDEQRLDREAAEREARQARTERSRREGASGLPPTLRRVDLDKLEHAGCGHAIGLARAWARRELHGLLLTGPFGTGKSTIAAGALWLLLAERAGRWVSVPELFRMLATNLGSEPHELALDLIAARRPLILDDLDKGRPTEYGAEQVFVAVDNAVARGQQLLVTTNLSLGQLAAKWPAPFGEAIASRLVGHCTAAEVTGRDRRFGGPAR